MNSSDWSRRKFMNTGFYGALGVLGMGGGMGKVLSNTIGRKKLPGGFWPVMMTPYHEDLTIDYQGLKRLIRWYEDAGASGLFANCGSSEMYELRSDERIDLTKFIVDNSRLPVVSTGTFYDTEEANINFIREMDKTGVDAVVIIPSILVEEEASDEALMKYFRNIMDRTQDIPLGIYECPGPYHRLISAEMLSELKGTGRFSYFKDTSCDAEVVDEKIDTVSDSPIGIYNAHSPDVLHSIRSGGAGISCIAGNYYPELFVYIAKNGANKNMAASVNKVNDFILEKESVIGTKYKLAAKYFMNLRGLELKVNSRQNYEPLNQEEKKRLDVLWQELRDLGEEVGIDFVTYA